MKSIRPLASASALVVLLMCFYAFLLGNKVFDGKFENETIAWYILAQGIFCSVALSRILDGIIAKLGG
jgi:phosphatidylglycerophosphate synthase